MSNTARDALLDSFVDRYKAAPDRFVSPSDAVAAGVLRNVTIRNLFNAFSATPDMPPGEVGLSTARDQGSGTNCNELERSESANCWQPARSGYSSAAKGSCCTVSSPDTLVSIV